jgi:hypothetical protein
MYLWLVIWVSSICICVRELKERLFYVEVSIFSGNPVLMNDFIEGQCKVNVSGKKLKQFKERTETKEKNKKKSRKWSA